MQAARPLCLRAVEFLRETPHRRPTPLHLQSILSSRSAPSSRQSPPAPAGGRSTRLARQNAPAPPPPEIPSVSAPSPHRLHSPDRACAARPCCPAPRRRKSPPHHPLAASSARLQTPYRSARGRSGLRRTLRQALCTVLRQALCQVLRQTLRRLPPTRRLPVAKAPLRRPLAAPGPLPNIPDSPKSPAMAPSLQTAESLAHNNRRVRPAPAPLPADQPSRPIVLPRPSILQKKVRRSSSDFPVETRLPCNVPASRRLHS